MTKRQTLRFVAVCYGAVLAWFLLSGLYGFAADALARANGGLATQTYDFTQLYPQGMDVLSPTEAVTTSDDAQLFISIPDGRAAQLNLAITYSEEPGEVTLYYADSDGVFAKEKKIWGALQPDGSYSFALPRSAIHMLRIDPTNKNHVQMRLVSCVLNAPRSFGSYFAVSYAKVLGFLVYPALFAAGAAWCYTAFGAALWKKYMPRLAFLKSRTGKKEG